MRNGFYWKRHHLQFILECASVYLDQPERYSVFELNKLHLLCYLNVCLAALGQLLSTWLGKDRNLSFPNQVERSCPGAAPRWPSNGLTCLKWSRTAPDSLLAFTQSTFCLVCSSSVCLWLIEIWKVLAGIDTLLYLGNGGPEVAASDPALSAHTFVCLINTCVCLAPRDPDTCPPCS